MSDHDETMFQATLTEGQTYVYSGKTFTFGVPVLIDNATRLALRRDAVKSVKQGDGTMVRRVSVQMFQFAKVKKVQAPVVPVVAEEDDDADDLDEVIVMVGADGNPVEQAGTEEVAAEAAAPPAPEKPRSRTRAAQG